MSSDNFWFVEGNEVYMGFASDWEYEMRRAEDKARRKFIKRRIKQSAGPQFIGADQDKAVRWAVREYSEYGLWWIDGADRF